MSIETPLDTNKTNATNMTNVINANSDGNNKGITD